MDRFFGRRQFPDELARVYEHAGGEEIVASPSTGRVDGDDADSSTKRRRRELSSIDLHSHFGVVVGAAGVGAARREGADVDNEPRSAAIAPARHLDLASLEQARELGSETRPAFSVVIVSDRTIVGQPRVERAPSEIPRKRITRVACVLANLIDAVGVLVSLNLREVPLEVFDFHTQHEVPAVLGVLR